MKGTVEQIFLILAILLGIIGVIIVPRVTSGLDTPEAKSLELATAIASYASALSSVEAGRVEIRTGDSFTVTLQEAYPKPIIVRYFKGDREATGSAVVVAYEQKQVEPFTYEKINRVCVVKEPGKDLAEVVRC
ncbi:MAG: hypothetical protein HY367_01100 [Candidatus Aenigmarchaeota archaeon]|nr:hypothetical protein [Candidatus Aenigmarchaeota archaeon]